jgi:TetR/AcrR family transcriptional repressor for divergent bdcA
VLYHWTGTAAIPLADILRPEVPVAKALAAMLEEAARRYASDPAAGGCLVLEGTRCNDEGAREAARALNLGAEAFIRDYIAARHPEAADEVSDFVSTTMSGLSAKARSGHDLPRLLATARLAGSALAKTLPA